MVELIVYIPNTYGRLQLKKKELYLLRESDKHDKMKWDTFKELGINEFTKLFGQGPYITITKENGDVSLAKPVEKFTKPPYVPAGFLFLIAKRMNK